MQTERSIAMQPLSTAPESIRLATGQSIRFHAHAGTRIVVTSGCMEVCEPPVWLCERLVSPRCTVRDGEQYLVRQRGWVTLHAQGGAALFCFAPATRGGVAARLRGLEAWLASCLRRVRPRKPA
jgi:hypothetical protein